jgi:hypothetical protein
LLLLLLLLLLRVLLRLLLRPVIESFTFIACLSSILLRLLCSRLSSTHLQVNSVDNSRRIHGKMGSNKSSGGLGYRREKGEDFIIVFVGRLVLHAGHLTGSVFISLCLV